MQKSSIANSKIHVSRTYFAILLLIQNHKGSYNKAINDACLIGKNISRYEWIASGKYKIQNENDKFIENSELKCRISTESIL